MFWEFLLSTFPRLVLVLIWFLSDWLAIVCGDLVDPKTVVQGLGPYLGRTADVFFCPTGLVPCWDFVFGFDDIPHSLSSAGPRGRCTDAQDAQNNVSQFGPTWTVPLTKIDTPPHWFFKHPNGPHFFNICLQFDKKIFSHIVVLFMYNISFLFSFCTLWVGLLFF